MIMKRFGKFWLCFVGVFVAAFVFSAGRVQAESKTFYFGCEDDSDDLNVVELNSSAAVFVSCDDGVPQSTDPIEAWREDPGSSLPAGQQYYRVEADCSIYSPEFFSVRSDSYRIECRSTGPGGGQVDEVPDINTSPLTASSDSEEFRVESDCENLDNCGIIDSLIDLVNILSAAVGVIIVIMIAVGGVQYTMSRDNPQAVAAARQRIFNAILAFVVFMGMVAFLQWLVPGGIFSG